MTKSEIEIKPVETRRERRLFFRFNYELYKDNPYAVPDLLEDGLDTFNPNKNAAFEFCDAKQFLAYCDGKIVGRVAAIINHRANETWNTKHVRFGWLDFIDDQDVSEALFDAVAKWGKENGMTHMVGPLGFTDMDPEGMLVEGFDQLSTMSTIYNYPYYPEHMDRLGFEKETGWVERKVRVPERCEGKDPSDEKYFRVAKIVEQRMNLKVRKFKTLKEVKEAGYVEKFFDVINRSYAPLYGYTQLSPRQVEMYGDNYLRFIDMRLVTFVENQEGEVVAIGVGMGSLSKALQKAKGKLLPFGWFHLLRALKSPKYRSNIVDLLLVGVVPEYQGKGVNALLFADLIPIAMELGFTVGETHLQLEDNDKSQNQWAYLDCEIHKRRKCYIKEI